MEASNWAHMLCISYSQSGSQYYKCTPAGAAFVSYPVGTVHEKKAWAFALGEPVIRYDIASVQY
jgi:hypothetical protein